MNITDCKRATRHAPGGARVTARDLDLLRHVGLAGVATTSQIERICGLSPDMAYRRLRVMRDLGLLQVHVVSLHQENRYTLTAAGRIRLAQALDCPLEEIHVVRGLRAVSPHHEGTVDVYASLLSALRTTTELQIDQFLFERDVRAQLGNPRGAQVPDAIAIVRGCSDQRMAAVIETDLNTETVSWVVRHKGVPYADLRELGQRICGCTRWRVACVVPSAQRRNALTSEFWAAGVPEDLWFVAVASDLQAQSILDAIWWTPRLSGNGKTARLSAEELFAPVKTNRPNSLGGLRR